MDEQSRPPGEPVLARTHFHITLGLILVPCLLNVLGWLLVTLNIPNKSDGAEQRKWARRLFALALVDTLLLGCFILMMTMPARLSGPAPEAPRTMVGLSFEDPQSLKVGQVLADLPAARGGLEAGDVIEKVDGKAVATPKAFADAVQTPGQPLLLTVRRGDRSIERTLIPELRARIGDRGLFAIEPTPDFRLFSDFLVELIPALVVIALLAGWRRWKPAAGVPVWGGFLLALLGTFGMLFGFFKLVLRWKGGWSLGMFLVAVLMQGIVALLLTAAARRWMTRPTPPESPTRSPFRAALLGIFYLVTGIPRLMVLLGVASRLLFPDLPLGDPMSIRLSQAHFGPAGAVLLFAGLAVVGPLAEEVLFRGYLLPRLVLQWGERWGLLTSSLLFALLHLRDGPFLPMIFFYGWVFGWARLRSGGVGASTAMHMAVNAFVATMILRAK
jgi:membrane protease YdiL (CAAX protease family)